MDASLAKRAAGLTEPFWDAATRGVLVRPVCRKCGLSHFTPKWSCPHCLSEDWGYEPSTGRGVVYSSTVVHRGPDPTWPTPYVLVIVDMEEGWSMLSRLVVPSPGDCESFGGRAVEVRFEPEGREPNRTLPVFALTGLTT